MDFLTNLNLNKNELQNARIQNLSTAPSNPKAGLIYFDTTDSLLKQYDGTNWVPVGKDTYIGTATFADDTTNTANSPVKMTLTRQDKDGTSQGTVTANIPKVSSSSAGVAPKGASVSTQSQTTKFLREDGSWSAPSYSAGTVTSVRVQATSPVQSSVSTAQSSTLNTTISLEDGYGDTKNPYASKTMSYVLAAPSNANGVPSFRLLNASDIPADTRVGSASFTDATSSSSSSPVKFTLNSVESGGISTELLTANIPKVSSTSAGVAPKGAAVSTQSQSTKFLREDGTWAAPSYTANNYSNYVKKDGTTAMTGALNMNSHKITSVTDPTNDQDAATKKYVDSAISGLPTPMQFKGTIGTGGTIEWSALPAAASTNDGHTYKVITDHATDPICKSGDTIVSNGSSWIVIPSGDEPSGTVTNVATGSGLTGGPITSSGTISLASAYGDTVNPYGSKTKNYVLAAPNGSNGTPSFRALVAADIPNLSSTYKTVQTAKTDPSAGNTGALAFISAITQDANGEITATKEPVKADSTPTEDSANLVTSGGVYSAIQTVVGGSVVKKIVKNPALTASGGSWTWTIAAADALGTADIAVTLQEISTGAQVLTDIAVNQSTGAITITINDTAGAGSLAANTYKAVIVG